MTQQYQTPEDVILRRLIVAGTDGYHKLYQRPYEINVSNRSIDAVSNILDENRNSINDNTFRSIVGEILAPSANVDEHYESFIPNGWGERRLRFILEVEVRYRHADSKICYYQGYTTFDGWSDSAKDFDSEMEFIINSYIHVVRRIRPYPNGERSVIDIICDSGQFESDNQVSTMLAPTNTYIMRPQDIFRKLTEDEQSNLMGMYEDAGSGMNYRNINDQAHGLHAFAKSNNRRNNIPSAYFSRVIDGYYKSIVGDTLYNNTADVYRTAVGHVTETDAGTDPFILFMNGIVGRMTGHRFTWKTLLKVDPTIYDRLDIIKSGDSYSRQIIGKDGEYWTGSDMTTQVANIVIQAIPALMTRHNLTNVSYYCTNMTIDGSIDSRILHARSVSNADMTFFYQRFEDDFPSQVAYSFSSGYNIPFSISVDSDLFGDTILTISINDEPETKFVLPTFCDSLIPPILTSDNDHYDNIVQTTKVLVSGVIDNTEFSTANSIEEIITNNGGASSRVGSVDIFKSNSL